MLERKLYSTLIEWKARKNHKCLVITGQRQVGKTFIVDAFAKEYYEHYVYINFNDQPERSEIFDEDITIDELIRRLTLTFGSDSIVDDSTLIFLDEIQDCPRAYSSLKQFTKYRKLDVIASGSLLGVVNPMKDEEKEPLIPMGYETQVLMRPLDFEEFLWAMGFPKDGIKELRSCIREKRAIDGTAFKRLSELYRIYLIVGGMPEAVQSYVDTGDFRASNAVQTELLSTCRRDITRYTHNNDKVKTTECFDCIPSQLADTNKKFMYSRINNSPSRKSKDIYKENLLWIKGAGYGLFCYGLEQPALPLTKYVKRDVFKVYMSDTGCLLKEYGDKARLAIYNGDNRYNNGAVIENAVADGIAKCGYPLMYYKKDKGENKMEMDFVLEFWDGLAAIEVKSGDSVKSASLDKIARVFDVRRRIKLETDNIHIDADGVEHYPVFASAFIDEMDVRSEGPSFS